MTIEEKPRTEDSKFIPDQIETSMNKSPLINDTFNNTISVSI